MLPHKYNVLLVDDSVLIVNRITDLLSEVACIGNISKAATYSEAAKLLHTDYFDVALLDINLPGKNGIELLAHIRSCYPHMKIIMLSNQSNSYYRNLCQTLGSNSFIDKSGEFEKIPSVINSYYDQFVHDHL